VRGLLIALMMEAARTPETLVNFYQTTRRYNPEDSHHRNVCNLLKYVHLTAELQSQMTVLKIIGL
jgi:hypothetical protein